MWPLSITSGNNEPPALTRREPRAERLASRPGRCDRRACTTDRNNTDPTFHGTRRQHGAARQVWRAGEFGTEHEHTPPPGALVPCLHTPARRSKTRGRRGGACGPSPSLARSRSDHGGRRERRRRAPPPPLRAARARSPPRSPPNPCAATSIGGGSVAAAVVIELPLAQRVERANEQQDVEDEADAEAADERVKRAEVRRADARAGPRADVVEALDHDAAVRVVLRARRPVPTGTTQGEGACVDARGRG